MKSISVDFDGEFSSQQAFTKSFTQLYGIPPAMFRRLKMYHELFPYSEEIRKGIKKTTKYLIDKISDKVHPDNCCATTFNSSENDGAAGFLGSEVSTVINIPEGFV